MLSVVFYHVEFLLLSHQRQLLYLKDKGISTIILYLVRLTEKFGHSSWSIRYNDCKSTYSTFSNQSSINNTSQSRRINVSAAQNSTYSEVHKYTKEYSESLLFSLQLRKSIRYN